MARPSRRSRCAARAGSTAVRAQTTTGRPEPGRRGQHLRAGLPPAACSVRPGRHTRPDRDPHDSRTRPLTKFIYARRARARSAAPLPEWHHDLIHWHSSLQSRPFVNDTPARCVCRSAGTCRVLCRCRVYAASFVASDCCDVVTSSWHLALLKGPGSFTIIVQKVAKAMAGTFTRKPRGKKKLRVPGIHLKSSG